MEAHPGEVRPRANGGKRSSLHATAMRVGKWLNPRIASLERLGAGSVAPPPLLVVGPPRSGTTLVYQLLVQHLDVAYLSNAHHALFGAPFLVERIVPKGLRQPPSDYESRFGRTRGIWAPSEAGNFWYRFFPAHPHAVAPDEVSPLALGRLRSSVAAMTRASGRALVMKNVMCSVRMAAISAAVPEMRYLVVHRDLVDTAVSLLASRREANGTYDAWWSVEPREIESMRHLPPEQQVVEQIRAVEASIEASRAGLDPDLFADVSYADLIADPQGELTRVAARFGLSRRPGSPPMPARFDRRGGHTLDADLMERLERYANT